METNEDRLNEINLDRVQKKGEKLSYHEYEKDRTVQHKKRKGTLRKITYTDNMNTREAEFSDDTSPIDKEEGLNDRKYDRNKNIIRIKSQYSQMTLPVLIWREM